jgi:hypothetical protein
MVEQTQWLHVLIDVAPDLAEIGDLLVVGVGLAAC